MFVDYDGLIYCVLVAVYSCSVEYPDYHGQNFRHGPARTSDEARPLLVLDILKLIAKQGGTFDVLAKRKWENMNGFEEL